MSNVPAPYVMPSTPADIIRQMIAEIGARRGVRLQEILSFDRRRTVVRARYTAIRAIHAEFPHLSYPQLGRIFGRDHSTIMYACGALKLRSAHDLRQASRIAAE